MRLLLLSVAFTFIASIGFSQTTTHSYSLHIGHEQAGKMTVSKTAKGNKIEYTLVSDAKFHVMGISQHIKEELKVIFINGKLFSSDVKIYKNGDIHKTTTARLLTNGHYKLVTNGHTHDVAEAITFSSVMIYFEEPSKQTKTFAEGDGVFKSITPNTSDHSYLVREGHHGSPSTFYFKNNGVDKVIVDYHVTTFEMRRV